MHGSFEAAIEDKVLLATVGDDLDFADDDISTIGATVHMCGEREFELADALGVEGELRAADAAGFDRYGLLVVVVVQTKTTSSGCSLRLDLAGFAGVVVDRDRDGDTVALGERDGQVEVDEEVLEDLEARGTGT